MRFIVVLAGCGALAFSGAAIAQSVGMLVTGPNGAAVGRVKAINGENLLVSTGKHDILVPKTSFTLSGGKLLFGMTKDEVDSEFDKNAAAAAAAVTPGATVKGIGGTEIGKIESATEGHVILALSSGKKVQLPRDGVRGNADGSVTIGFTAQQLEAQIGLAE